MREQQRSAQISFILCQLWIGAEEANSLESYKKKVSEIIKQPATGLSAHSQPDWGTVETSCQVSVWPSEHRHFNSLGSYKKKKKITRAPGSPCLFVSLLLKESSMAVLWIIWPFQDQKLGIIIIIITTVCTAVWQAWRMDTARAHTSHWETYFSFLFFFY